MSLMPLTRVQNAEAFAHVVNTVFDMADTEPLPRALAEARYTEIGNLISMTLEDLDALEYNTGTADSPVHTKVQRPAKSFIRMLQAYTRHRDAKANPIGDDWTSLWRVPEFPCVASCDSSYSNNGPPTAEYDIRIFRRLSTQSFQERHIKQESGAFSPLKEMKQWDQYKQSTTAQARAQDVADILDPTYVPTTQEAKDLFAAKQQFMYAMFEKTLLTDFGKSVVRAHKTDGNAQKVFQEVDLEVMEHAEKSTVATIDAANIMTYITSARWETWGGTAMGFILHWLDQVRCWESLVPKTDQLQDNLKKTLLENAVHGHSDLKTVKENLIQQCAFDKTKVASLDMYVTLLKSAAVNYDSKQKPGNGAARPKRSVYSHDFEFDIDGNDSTFDIDSSLDTILAHAHIRTGGRNSARMSISKWRSLLSEDQSLWDQFSEKTKSLLLGASPGPSPRETQVVTPPSRDASLHETLESQREGSDGDIDDSRDSTGADNDDAARDDILAFASELSRAATNPKGIPPSNIRRVLSGSMARNSRGVEAAKRLTAPKPGGPAKTKQAANEHRVSYQASVHEMVDVADDSPPPLIPRRQSHEHHTMEDAERMTYSVSNHKTLRSAALVDRGANGCVIGVDCRPIPDCPRTHQTVDVGVIDGHQITDIPILSAASHLLANPFHIPYGIQYIPGWPSFLPESFLIALCCRNLCHPSSSIFQ